MKILKYLTAIFGLTMLCSCSEIEHGVNDMDTWTDIVGPQEYLFTHPCMLHTQSDIDYVKENLSKAPWNEAYQKLETNALSDPNRIANPTELISRTNGNAECPNNVVNFGRDCASVYQLALRWALKGETAAADRAIQDVMAWVAKCKGIHHNGDTNQTLILFQVYQIANGMEILRDYNEWGNSEDFKKACDWLVDCFYPQASDFLKRHNNTTDHYWLNWDLAAMTAILSMGILTDNQDMVNEAIIYFKNGVGAGYYEKAAPYVFDDPDEPGFKIAQCNESGRDQGHCTLCAVLMAGFCQMALNIGEDLFAYGNYRMLAMAEYIAKYNTPKIGITSPTGDGDFMHSTNTLPYKMYVWCPDSNNRTGERTEMGADGRGKKRPGWEIYRNYGKRHGVKTKYVDEMANYLFPDGGAGEYDKSTGGYDQAGCSSLMFYRE